MNVRRDLEKVVEDCRWRSKFFEKLARDDASSCLCLCCLRRVALGPRKVRMRSAAVQIEPREALDPRFRAPSRSTRALCARSPATASHD